MLAERMAFRPFLVFIDDQLAEGRRPSRAA
jgi:hypothetical protein